MRFMLGAILLCLAAPLSGLGDDQVTSSEQIDRKRELKEWKREFVRGDLKRIVKRTPHPFRRWSDGSVSYVGKVAWEQNQPGYSPTSEDQEIGIILGGFVVQEISEVGAMIQTRGAGLSYVSGMTGFSLKTYSKNLMLRRSGTYTYKTVLGSVRRLPGFEYGEPITEEEYLRSMRRADVPEPVDTNAGANASEHE